MSKRLPRKDFAKMLGIHEKTIERYHGPDVPDVILSPEQLAFRQNTGYMKNPMNGRVTFDDHFARIFAANLTGNDSLRSDQGPETDAIDAEIVTGSEIERQAPAAAIERSGGNGGGGADFIAAFTIAQLLPHKIVLTLAEAADLSGLTRSQLKPYCRYMSGRWKITRAALDLASADIWKKSKTAAPPTRTIGRKK